MDNTLKAEKAKRLIKQSVEIKEGIWNDKRDNINIDYKMAFQIGDGLTELLGNDDNIANTDWHYKMYYFKSLLKELLILLAKPGVLEKLHFSERETAAPCLGKLISFFEQISDDNTLAYLHYFVIDQYSHAIKEEDIDEKIKYYDFQNVLDNKGDKTCWYSPVIDAKQLEKMKEYYKTHLKA